MLNQLQVDTMTKAMQVQEELLKKVADLTLVVFIEAVLLLIINFNNQALKASAFVRHYESKTKAQDLLKRVISESSYPFVVSMHQPFYLPNPDGSPRAFQWKKNYRLPTEAEWEYFARAGQEHSFSGSDTIEEVGWYGENSNNTTQPIAQKMPNAWGACDMTGNLWEWVWDSVTRENSEPYPYTNEERIDPTGPPASNIRNIRGGRWGCTLVDARASCRSWVTSSLRSPNIGFRFVRSIL